MCSQDNLLCTNLYDFRWLPTAPVNLSAAMSLVDAELASLLDQPEALKLYDITVK
jgi:hypothetical protein